MNELQTISLLIGGLAAGSGCFMLMKPAVFIALIKAFPRNKMAACILTAIDLTLAAIYINRMYLGAFDSWKPGLFAAVPIIWFLCVKYMDELLAARALGGLLLLVANPILRAARWAPECGNWWKVISALAYIWIVYGLILLTKPYHFRKQMECWLKFDPSLKRGGLIKLFCGIAIAILAIGVYG